MRSDVCVCRLRFLFLIQWTLLLQFNLRLGASSGTVLSLAALINPAMAGSVRELRHCDTVTLRPCEIRGTHSDSRNSNSESESEPLAHINHVPIARNWPDVLAFAGITLQ